MGYRDREKKRITAIRDDLFGDAGGGIYAGAPRDFVLADASLNLCEAVRADALDYFKRNAISWWRGDTKDELPTGHLLSSQVACVNHLFALRKHEGAATALLKALDPDVETALIVDDGYVEFEFIGERQYLKEKSFTRGAHCTSVDAAMIGQLKTGAKRLFLIEWKYTEAYTDKDYYIPERAKVYDALITAEDGPFKEIEPRALYFEPFYQLMRQTLLGQLMASNNDHGVSSYLHVHVAPQQNRDFHDRVTAKALTGPTVSDAWRNVLKDPSLFVGTTGEALLAPAVVAGAPAPLVNYLRRRYWTAPEQA